MTYKTITGSYPTGFVLSNAYTGLNINPTAFVGGGGVSAFFATTINNSGYCVSNYLVGTHGIYIKYGGLVRNEKGAFAVGISGVSINNNNTSNLGSVDNYGTISGIYGVLISQNGVVSNRQNSPIQSQASGGRITGQSVGVAISGGQGTITNHGTIYGGHRGVSIDQGQIVNGSGYYTASLIESPTTGVYASGAATVTNFGAIRGVEQFGVFLPLGGAVINGSFTDTAASIEGYRGVAIRSIGTLINLGTVAGEGRYAYGARIDGGVVKNGGQLDTSALISGTGGLLAASGTLTVSNYGAIQGLYGTGVDLFDGGTLTNGTRSDTAASIRAAGVGIYAGKAVATLTNYGTVFGIGDGVHLLAGGTLTNGSLIETGARVEGYSGFFASGASARVVNYGTILGTARYGEGIFIVAGGVVTNGGVSDTAALIDGSNTGVDASANATIDNFATIRATHSAGVYLKAGGVVTNGGGVDRSASIEGQAGIVVRNAAGTVRNFGTVVGSGADYSGVVLGAGGVLANGSANNDKALIEGYFGVSASAAATVTNFGTIWGQGDMAGSGVDLGGGGSLTNGAAGHAGAVTEGYVGIETGVSVTATVTNFGTIAGAGGTAVQFNSSTDELVVEAGSSFVGAVVGGGGTLDLASGVGTLSGLGGGGVTVSGSMATTAFTAFNTIEVAAGASFTDAGSAILASGQTLLAKGTLTVGGSANAGILSVAGGTLTVNGAVSGAGHVTMAGGTVDFTSTFNQAITFSPGVAVVELARSQTYTALLTGFSKTGATTLDLVDIAFGSKTQAIFAGTATSGVLTVTDGTHTAKINLKGDYRTSTFTVASDGHGGTDVKDPAKIAGPPGPLPPWVNPSAPHRLIDIMASLGASGVGAAWQVQPWREAPPTLVGPRIHLA